MKLDDFLKFLPGLEQQIRQAVQEELQAAAPEILGAVQDRVGHYGEWPRLARYTEKERERLGYPIDEPLLRTGKLRDSYTAEVQNTTLSIGSDYPVARYMELGEGSVPPRPILEPVVNQHAGKVAERIGQTITDIILQKNSD